MKIMVAGLPGSGKTTQAEKLSQDLEIPYISMGAVLREVSEEKSELGEKVRQAVSTGELVDNKLTAEILEKVTQENKYQKGFIIDGFPRDIEQLTYFDPKYDFVFYLKITPAEGRKRLLKRHRGDDVPEVIDHRFEVQLEKLKPLLEYLKEHYDFYEIDGERNIEEIHQQMMGKVGEGRMIDSRG